LRQAYRARRVNWLGSDGKPEVTTTTIIACCKYYAPLARIYVLWYKHEAPWVAIIILQIIFCDKQCFCLLKCAGDSFLYFGFGSNLLAARIQLQNPSAVFHTTARLSDYHLGFDRSSSEWMGASATITSLAGDHVWGVVWLIKSSELSNLDDQEGVHDNVYKVLTAISMQPVQNLPVCLSEHVPFLYSVLTRKQKDPEKPKLVRTFTRAAVTSVPDFS